MNEIQEKCKECGFWRELDPEYPRLRNLIADNKGLDPHNAGYPVEDKTIGQCRRFPPRPARSAIALTYASYWCGEWKTA